MGRKNTRAKQILDGAQGRMDTALEKLDELRRQVAIAEAEWRAHAAAFYSLQKELAPKPRQQPAATKGVASKRSGGGKKKREPELPLMCDYVFPDDGRAYAGHTCTATKDNAIHNDEFNYVGYHPFVSPAQPATPQSPPNGAGAGLGVSSAMQPDAVTSVAHAASEGE